MLTVALAVVLAFGTSLVLQYASHAHLLLDPDSCRNKQLQSISHAVAAEGGLWLGRPFSGYPMHFIYRKFTGNAPSHRISRVPGIPLVTHVQHDDNAAWSFVGPLTSLERS